MYPIVIHVGLWIRHILVIPVNQFVTHVPLLPWETAICTYIALIVNDACLTGIVCGEEVFGWEDRDAILGAFVEVHIAPVHLIKEDGTSGVEEVTKVPE